MSTSSDSPTYDALAIPTEATANGGTEILRAGLIDDELYVTARHAFKDPAQWGEVLADITRRLALLYSMETDLSEMEALVEIEEAYAAEMGAKVVEDEATPSSAGASRARKRKAAPRAAKGPRRKPADPPTGSES